MSNRVPYVSRINNSSKNKHTSTILALDMPYSSSQTINQIIKLIEKIESYICGVKMNFHILLAHPPQNIKKLNNFIHSLEIQSIADIKLNDIMNSNSIVLNILRSLDFDCVIANPIMGKDALRALVNLAHKLSMGVISVVYMSSPFAFQTYGLKVIPKLKIDNQEVKNLYDIFLDYSKFSKVDGIVVGATQIPILRTISGITEIPIYSPGIGSQGGDARKAITNGSTYLIVGRSVLESIDPVGYLRIIKQISNISHQNF